MADKSLTPIDLPELSSAPASPASGFHRFYAKTDGKAYSKSSAGTEYDLTTGVSLTTTGTSGAATLVGTTLNIPVYQSALTNPVTGTGTAGQVAYFNGTSAVTGSNNLVWDNANGRLGIGTNAPTKYFQINLPTGVNTLENGFVLSRTGTTGTLVFGNGTTSLLNFSPYIYGRASSGINGFLLSGSVFDSSTLVPALNFEAANSSYNNVILSNQKILRVANWTNYYLEMFGNGNMLLQNGGTFTDNGQRLQVYGSTLLRGSGTTSATTALLVQNSTPTELFKVADNGNANFNNDLTVSGVFRETVTANRQAASYTLALTDRGKLVEMDVATANNLTVPLNSSIAFPVGTKIDIVQYGAGQTTIVATGGVTLRSTNNWLKINARYGAVTLVKIATDEWYVFGNLNA